MKNRKFVVTASYIVDVCQVGLSLEEFGKYLSRTYSTTDLLRIYNATTRSNVKKFSTKADGVKRILKAADVLPPLPTNGDGKLKPELINHQVIEFVKTHGTHQRKLAEALKTLKPTRKEWFKSLVLLGVNIHTAKGVYSRVQAGKL